MAVKPNENDAFLREVDEELRKERLNRIFTRYGWAIIAGILLLLAAIGGYIWWQERREARAAEQGEALLRALDSLEAGNRNAAAPVFEELAESGTEGYRAAALFSQAGAQAQAGDTRAAAELFGAIAADEDLAEPYRNAALIRQTALLFDTLPPPQVIERLRPLAQPGNPWFGAAGEMVAIAHIRMNRPDLAAPIFAGIARDETAPPSVRTRAVQMAGSLGINAVEDAAAPTSGQTAAQGQEAATKEKAE